MVTRYFFIFAILILSACSREPVLDPNSIQLGDNPSSDLEQNATVLKKLPPNDIATLNNYLVFAGMNKEAGKPHPASGKTISEAIQDAKAWKASQSVGAIEEKKRVEDVRKRADQLQKERNAMLEKIAGVLNVSYVKRSVLPADPAAERDDPLIQIAYDIENKGAKPILALKGRGIFKDSSGRVIVDHPFVADKTVTSGGHIQVNLSYRIVPIWRDMINFTKTEEGKFVFSFEPEVVILEGGEKLTVPGTAN